MINTNILGEKIDSPLSAFNNFLLELGKDFNNVFGVDIYKTNDCVFFNDYILLFGFVKLINLGTQLGIKCEGLITTQNQNILLKCIENKTKLFTILNKYMFIMNEVTKNYDDSITSTYINIVLDSINKGEKKYHPIPFQHKIKQCFDTSLIKLTERDTFVLNVKLNENKTKYICDIIRLESSMLDESISIENTRFMEKEICVSGEIPTKKLKLFIINLMFYGEIVF